MYNQTNEFVYLEENVSHNADLSIEDNRRFASYHYDKLRRAHHSFLTRCIGWQTKNRAYHPICYLNTYITTGSESIEATKHGMMRILFAGFVARKGGTRLPNCVMFGESVGGAGCMGGGAGKRVDGMFFWTTLELLASTPISGRLQPRTKENSARRRNKG